MSLPSGTEQQAATYRQGVTEARPRDRSARPLIQVNGFFAAIWQTSKTFA
jgi:hypothetical protein